MMLFLQLKVMVEEKKPDYLVILTKLDLSNLYDGKTYYNNKSIRLSWNSS